MDYLARMSKNIKAYLSERFLGKEFQEIDLNFEKLNGLSNDVYHVKIIDKSTNSIIQELIYRQFNNISEIIDRCLETAIIDNLSKEGLTPKIYKTDDKSYRIEEFLMNSNVPERSCLKENDFIDTIIQVLISYSMISGIYCYKIHSEKFSHDYKIQIDEDLKNCSHQIEMNSKNNIFDRCTKSMLIKAVNNFENFSQKFKMKYSKLVENEFQLKFEKLKKFLKNYEKTFSLIFPKDGFLVLNHNDVHSLNLLLTDNQNLKIIDHEYACLNLIGLDFVNYLLETHLDYTIKTYPYYRFDAEDMNFENYFETFQIFLTKFEIANAVLFTDENYRKKFQKLKKYKYFLRLVCIASLIWILFSFIYLDYEAFCEKSTFNYFQHGIDRILIFEEAYYKLKSLID